MPRLLLTLLAAASFACLGAAIGGLWPGADFISFAKADTMTALPVTRDAAPALVAERYGLLLAPLFITHPLDKDTTALPPLAAADFTVTDETATAWLVSHDPLSGATVRARVSKAEGLVEFDPVALAVE